jgi:SAM-dependent methyltransferase
VPEINRPASGWRWQDTAAGGGLMDEEHPVRRSGIGSHDIRFDGLSDLLLRARGASVIDIACNRGHVAYEFYVNGARIVHGCDIYGPGIMAARHWFAELPHVESKFEIVDLEKGPAALTAAFGRGGYDIVLFLGIYHKLKRSMSKEQLDELVMHLGQQALTYFAWSGYEEDLDAMDAILSKTMRCIHTSEISMPGRPATIWKRR